MSRIEDYKMSIHKLLGIYLNDHLAGSTTAIELLTHLVATHAGDEFAKTATALREEILADRGTLQDLMRHLAISESPIRKASAWLAERVTQLKLRLDDAPNGQLHLLETIEAIALGIEGKRSLWQGLAAASKFNQSLKDTDYPTLIARAEEQRSAAETIRLTAVVNLCRSGLATDLS
jgi:hypothetical protein